MADNADRNKFTVTNYEIKEESVTLAEFIVAVLIEANQINSTNTYILGDYAKTAEGLGFDATEFFVTRYILDKEADTFLHPVTGADIAAAGLEIVNSTED